MTPIFSNCPYLLVAVELDSEWSRKRSFQDPLDLHPLSATRKVLDDLCAGYKRDVASHNRQEDFSLPDYLFSPKYFLPSGHSDCLALVLIDDQDALYHIAAHSRTIEDLTLCFCPTVESLGLSQFPFLVEPDRIWNSEQPVLTVSKFKIDGLCSLEYGLLFKRAIFRAAAIRCQLAISELKETSDTGGLSISFLCLQGQEELGIVISSRDPTINIGIASAVRTLCIKDIFAESSDSLTLLLKAKLGAVSEMVPPAPNRYRNGDLHRFLAEGVKSPVDELIVPVFRWSRSLLAFGLQDSSTLKPIDGIEGKVAIDIDAQVVPGLGALANETIFDGLDGSKLLNEWHLREVGSFDRRWHLGSEPRLVDAGKAVSNICESINSIVKESFDGKRSAIVGLRSTFLVPIPSTYPFLLLKQVDESFLDQVLPEIGRDVMAGKSIVAGLDLNRLKKVPKSYGLPRALRRSIEALFQSFITAVFNPNLLDLVSDLTDSFVTLHRILTISLPHTLRSMPKGGVIDQKRVILISRFATALRNALEKRLDLAYPDATIRNMAAQFPGSFAQVLFAADAPIKATLGVLKYHIFSRAYPTEDQKSGETILAPLNSLGLVTEPTLEPGIRCTFLELALTEGNEAPLPRLAHLHLDIDHLFHVGSYFDYAHESFHLIFDELFLKAAKSDDEIYLGRIIDYDDDDYRRERIEEIWVHLASFFFFAPDKPIEMFSYLIGRYCLDMRSGDPALEKTLRRFAEQFCRLLITAALVKNHESEEITVSEVIRGDCHKLLDECLPQFASFLPEYSELETSNQLEFLAAVKTHLDVFWEEAKLDTYVDYLWRTVNQSFFMPLCENVPELKKVNRNQDLSQLLQGGWCVTRHSEAVHVDPVAYVALLIGRYITRFDVNKDSEKKQHLERNSDGEIVFTEGVEYETFLIDRGSAQRFCSDPKARADRLVTQIAILESFWDFSSHFRARRILALLKGAQSTPKKD